MSTTVCVNGTVQFNDIERYHCHELRFAYCNTCTFVLSLLKLENGMKRKEQTHPKHRLNKI